MKKCFYISFFILLFIVKASYAAEVPIALERINFPTHDVAALKRGAKLFATYCMVCHSLKYMDHDPIARSAGITADKMPDKNKKWWFNAVPPDLTLAAKVHSPDWLYTYLHSFYKDDSRPLGWNNLLFDNTNMPNPFGGMQGIQILVVDKEKLIKNQSLFRRKPHYYSVLQLVTKGSMSTDEFDKFITDIVTFLVYAGEPKKIFRERLGVWVLLFLAVFFVLIWILKREYWRKIK